MRRLIRWGAGLAAVSIVAVLVAAVWLRAVMHTPLSIDAPVSLVVDPGASAAGVANDMHQRGWLPHPQIMSLWARATGDAARIRVGEYELEPGITPHDVLALFVAGKVKLYPVTLLEGWNWREVRAALQGHEAVEITLPWDSAETLASALELDAGHAEGQFFPDTYMVPRGTTDRALLQQANELLRTELAAAWADRDAKLPLQTPYELLTLGSIIERETSLDSERPRVAGVFVRRINKRMRLQTDPTVIYGLGERFDGNLTRKHLLTDTPYNTYTRSGLPPTPIAMTGRGSLRAAAQPAEGDALYFVASANLDGSHVFSVTLEEHNAAVAAYIAGLRRARLQQRNGQ